MRSIPYKFHFTGACRLPLAAVIAIVAIADAVFIFTSLNSLHPVFVSVVYELILIPSIFCLYLYRVDARWPYFVSHSTHLLFSTKTDF